ncbi:MAG: response regulator [Ferruginibacter sp.]
MKILLVDKNKAISFLIKTLLEKEYETFQVQDSYFAIKELRSNKTFDLIIISLDSKYDDNFQLLQHIKSSSLLKHLPVLVLANANDTNLENECVESGIEAYVEKPFDPLMFLQKIKGLLSIKQTIEPIKKHLKIFNLNFYF